MAFAWDDFLALAHRLAENSDQEADLRSAISRAYYAVYHAASRTIRSNELVPPTRSLTHRLVWDTLARDADATRSIIGRRGDRLKRLREDADYRMPFPASDLPAQVAFVLAEATNLIAAIAALA